jgi:hypothetical protein
MAFLFRPGGPQIGVAGAPALAGVTASAGSGAAAPADVSIYSDQARRDGGGLRT